MYVSSILTLQLIVSETDCGICDLRVEAEETADVNIITKEFDCKFLYSRGYDGFLIWCKHTEKALLAVNTSVLK